MTTGVPLPDEIQSIMLPREGTAVYKINKAGLPSLFFVAPDRGSAEMAAVAVSRFYRVRLIGEKESGGANARE